MSDETIYPEAVVKAAAALRDLADLPDFARSDWCDDAAAILDASGLIGERDEWKTRAHAEEERADAASALLALTESEVEAQRDQAQEQLKQAREIGDRGKDAEQRLVARIRALRLGLESIARQWVGLTPQRQAESLIVADDIAVARGDD